MEDTERGGGGGWGGHTNHHHKNPVSSFPPLFSPLYIFQCLLSFQAPPAIQLMLARSLNQSVHSKIFGAHLSLQNEVRSLTIPFPTLLKYCISKCIWNIYIKCGDSIIATVSIVYIFGLPVPSPKYIYTHPLPNIGSLGSRQWALELHYCVELMFPIHSYPPCLPDESN